MLQKRDNKIEKAFGVAPEGAKETEAKKSYRELGRERAERVKEKTKAALERSRGLGERAVGGLKRIGKTGVEYAFAVPELLKDAGKAGVEGIKGLGSRANDWLEKKFTGLLVSALETTTNLVGKNETMRGFFKDKIRETGEVYKKYIEGRRNARKAETLAEQRKQLETWAQKQNLNPERQKVANGKTEKLRGVDNLAKQFAVAV